MKNSTNPPFQLLDILWLTLFCTLIALFVEIILGDGLIKNLVLSEAIGIGIYVTVKSLIWLQGCNKSQLSSYLIGIPVGTVIGVLTGAWLTGTALTMARNGLLIPLATGIVFGIAVAYFFYSRSVLSEQKRELEIQARKRSEQEKSLMESQLRMLQAQIEPHFLFNSLANVISLIDSDTATAKKVLEQLSVFLRTSLHRTRNKSTTVKDEIQLLSAYLTIQQVRMGKRLKFHIDCPDKLLNQSLPPLLVQPLIENALKHGLENSIEGGEILIVFQQSQTTLMITVSDTGKGIQPAADAETAQQTGLRSIRDRLQALYGKTATLTLSENHPQGTRATLTLPLEEREKGIKQ